MYCTREDIESVWTPAGVLAAADDNANGSLTATEEAHIDYAIERAGNVMNAVLEVRYDLADLANSTWCRDCNAVLAAYFLAIRHDDVPAGIADEYARYSEDLANIRDGLLNVPEVAESDHHGPTTTNFAVDLRERRAKIRRVAETSTGELPDGELKQFPETD